MDRPELQRRRRSRQRSAQAVHLDLQFSGLPDQFQVFFDDRKHEPEIAAAALADERLVVELLCAEWTFHLKTIRVRWSDGYAEGSVFGARARRRACSARNASSSCCKSATCFFSSSFSALSASGIRKSLWQ